MCRRSPGRFPRRAFCCATDGPFGNPAATFVIDGPAGTTATPSGSATLTSGTTYVGLSGAGTFTQTGGTINASSAVFVGGNNGGPGTYALADRSAAARAARDDFRRARQAATGGPPSSPADPQWAAAIDEQSRAAADQAARLQAVPATTAATRPQPAPRAAQVGADVDVRHHRAGLLPSTDGVNTFSSVFLG